jgi:hypothetical protein
VFVHTGIQNPKACIEGIKTVLATPPKKQRRLYFAVNAIKYSPRVKRVNQWRALMDIGRIWMGTRDPRLWLRLTADH